MDKPNRKAHKTFHVYQSPGKFGNGLVALDKTAGIVCALLL
jgi:hypothetical protein